MHPATIATLTSLLCTAALTLAACTSQRQDPADPDRQQSPATPVGEPRGGEPPAASPRSFTGTLRGGMMAIGGETTGWLLVGEGQTGGRMVDVSRVQDQARRLEGQRVKVHGRLVERTWPESGTVHVLVADRIEPAPAPGAQE